MIEIQLPTPNISFLSISLCQLFAHSTNVMSQLRSNRTTSSSSSSDAALTNLHRSVGEMIHSYTEVWPKLVPSLQQLHSEQQNVLKHLVDHELVLNQGITSLSRILYHPDHGALVKMKEMSESESCMKRKLSHTKSVIEVLEVIKEIRRKMREFEANLKRHEDSITANNSPLTSSITTDSYLSLQSELASLIEYDENIAKADFYATLQHEMDGLCNRLIQRLLEQMKDLIQCQRGVKGEPTNSSNASFSSPISSTDSIILTILSQSTPSIQQLFNDLHALKATPRVMELLSHVIMHGILQPLVRYITELPTGLLTPLYFMTSKFSNSSGSSGKMFRLTFVDDSDSDEPILEGTPLEVILTIMDFVWQQLFSTMDTNTPHPLTDADSTLPRPSMPLLTQSLRDEFRVLARDLCHASIPNSIQELVQYGTQVEPKLRAFEKQAIERGLISSEEVATATAAAADDSTPSLPSSPSTPIDSFLLHIRTHYEQSIRSRVLHRTKMIVIHNTFETYEPNADDAAANNRAPLPTAVSSASLIYSSLFHRQSSSLPPPASVSQSSAHRLMRHHSEQIFHNLSGGSTSYAISKAANAFVNMIYELYYEAHEAKKKVSHQW